MPMLFPWDHLGQPSRHPSFRGASGTRRASGPGPSGPSGSAVAGTFWGPTLANLLGIMIGTIGKKIETYTIGTFWEL